MFLKCQDSDINVLRSVSGGVAALRMLRWTRLRDKDAFIYFLSLSLCFVYTV